MISIRKVNSKNVWKLLKLEVYDDQKDFVASNVESIVEAYTTVAAGGVALPFGIYSDDTPVGFLMIGYDAIPGETGPSIEIGNYSLWRFMIDKNYQGNGYGKAALFLALEYIRSYPCGEAKYCWLSYEPENTNAKRLYNSFGFLENGEYDESEVVACLAL